MWHCFSIICFLATNFLFVESAKLEADMLTKNVNDTTIVCSFAWFFHVKIWNVNIDILTHIHVSAYTQAHTLWGGFCSVPVQFLSTNFTPEVSVTCNYKGRPLLKLPYGYKANFISTQLWLVFIKLPHEEKGPFSYLATKVDLNNV